MFTKPVGLSVAWDKISVSDKENSRFSLSWSVPRKYLATICVFIKICGLIVNTYSVLRMSSTIGKKSLKLEFGDFQMAWVPNVLGLIYDYEKVCVCAYICVYM